MRGLTHEPDERLDIEEVISQLEEEMQLAARNLHFERAAIIRDQIKELKELSKQKI